MGNLHNTSKLWDKDQSKVKRTGNKELIKRYKEEFKEAMRLKERWNRLWIKYGEDLVWLNKTMERFVQAVKNSVKKENKWKNKKESGFITD